MSKYGPQSFRKKSPKILNVKISTKQAIKSLTTKQAIKSLVLIGAIGIAIEIIYLYYIR